MANGQGTATLDFGSAPGSNEASVAVSGQASINTTSSVEAYWMADDTTADHTANDHKYVPLFVELTCGTPVAATGFTLYGRSTERMQGTFKCRWVWSD